MAEVIISLAQARAVAQQAATAADPGTEWVMLDQQTLERPFGWVFFPTTARYAATRDIRDAKPGFGPLVVERATGRTHFLTTSRPPHVAIERFEAEWLRAGPSR